MQQKNQNKFFQLFVLFLSFTFSSFTVFAKQSYEEQYLNWQIQQQKQNAKLNYQEKKEDQHYLARADASTTTGKIKLNTASVDQLMQLSGVGQKKAEAIIEYRKKKGKFNSIEELQQVKGIGPALFNKNKSKLAL
jgi:competence protein ComEA